MGPFDHFHKNGTSVIKPKPLQLRREVVPQQPGNTSNTSRSIPRPSSSKPPARPTKRLLSKPALGLTKPSLGKPKKRASPAQPVTHFSTDESSEEDVTESSRKRVKLEESVEPDITRQVRCKAAFSKDGEEAFSMVHAADMVASDTSVKYVPIFEDLSDRVEVTLQYPSFSQRERYYLVKPQFGHDDFEALEDIIQVMRKVAEYYLPTVGRDKFLDESSGYPQKLSRAVKHRAEKDILEAIQRYNDALREFLKDGTIAKILDGSKKLDPRLVERILTQTYSRTVSPRVKSLRVYENGTDNVYGELLPKFVSDILKKDTRLKSDQIFVDLGSGVGNVVLQVALEIGCESWGCEIMKNACDLADLQHKEFLARCRLWGLNVGNIHLQRGDFLVNGAIAKILPKADVVLVNNQAFTPGLNEGLTSLFLDLKEGCRIVSLKSFVPAGHKITPRNLNSPYNVLAVEEKEYYSNCVSWTNAPGTYYVSKKDSSKIRRFADRNKLHL